MAADALSMIDLFRAMLAPGIKRVCFVSATQPFVKSWEGS